MLYGLAPLPYATGLMPRALCDEITVEFLPPVEEAEKLSFSEGLTFFSDWEVSRTMLADPFHKWLPARAEKTERVLYSMFLPKGWPDICVQNGSAKKKAEI